MFTCISYSIFIEIDGICVNYFKIIKIWAIKFTFEFRAIKKQNKDLDTSQQFSICIKRIPSSAFEYENICPCIK